MTDLITALSKWKIGLTKDTDYLSFQGGGGDLHNSNSSTPKTERKFLGLSLSPFGSPHSSNGHDSNGVNNGFAPGRNSKRSRSLIRRSSKKVKQQVNSVHNPEDCVIS